VLRAANCFRAQRVTLHEGSLIVADEETIGGVNTTPVTPLVSMLGIPPEAEIDIINDANTDSYWERSDRFDMALDLTAGREGLDALATAMRCWIAHVLGIDVTIEACELHDVDLVGMLGSMPTPPGSATCSGVARTLTRRPWRAWLGCSGLRFGIPRSCSTRSGASRSI
jgi:hypothetical protein